MFFYSYCCNEWNALSVDTRQRVSIRILKNNWLLTLLIITVIQLLIKQDPNFTHLAIDIQTLFILNFVTIVHSIVIFSIQHN